MSNPLSLTIIEGGPRILDVHLAAHLGFERPVKIRDLIKRNKSKLLSFGVLPTVGKTSGGLGGRPTAEYYLNQKQAIFICMKSETDRAFDVQIEIVRVFDSYLNGQQPSRTTLPPLVTAGHLERLNDAAQRLSYPFYMRNCTRLWFLKYAREFAGVHRLEHIPIARFDEVIDYLESQKKPIDRYLRERIKHERAWLTQNLKCEMDRRLGQAGRDAPT